MKTLKFRPHLVEKILSGAKTITWRLFDDKNLQVGDRLELINWDGGEKFAEAEIINIWEKQIKDLTGDDLKSNGWQDKDQAIKTLNQYYRDGVNDDTAVKIVEFRISTV